MQLTFFLPEIYRLATGGNVFNNKLLFHLKKKLTIKTVIIRRDFQITDLSSPANTDGVWLVDSLLLHHDYWSEFLKSQRQPKKFLLLHYLNLFDTAKQFSEEAGKERTLLPYFDGFIVTSQFSRQCLLKQEIHSWQIAVIQPGIERKDLLIQKIKSNKIPHLLTVSSIFPGKGLIEMISLLEQISDLAWQWEIIGEDRLDQFFAQLFREKLQASAIAGRVKVHPPRPQKELFLRYARSDIFLLPSHFETCSMVTMEAMASGLPVIAWQVGGLSELIEDQHTGYLIPYREDCLFLEKLRSLIENNKIRQDFTAAARKKSASFVDWRQSAGSLINFIQESKNRR
jgi:hypothetical protein